MAQRNRPKQGVGEGLKARQSTTMRRWRDVRMTVNFACGECCTMSLLPCYASHTRFARFRAQFGEPRKKTVFERSFFYPIRRIGMDSPREVRCMESVPKARHGILLARSQLALRHIVLCSVKDGTLAEQSALVRLQASLQTHFACLSRGSVHFPAA